MKFQGYMRPDGKVGTRNYLAIIPSVVCANEVAEDIAHYTHGSQAILHHQGCCQTPPDLERITESLIGLGKNPNAGAVLIISLGCEGVDTDRLEDEVRKTGKPVERVNIQEVGGSSKAIQQGIDKAQKLILQISKEKREEFDIRYLTMGIKCGASDTTSGVASNPVIGYVTDRLVDLGSTIIFGETTEFIGAEHILQRRAKTQEVARDIKRIVDEMESRAKAVGVDMRKGQPTPGNILGGLSTIEEKSLGAIVKSGSRTIEGVLPYTGMPPHNGLWIKDTPGREIEVLTAMAIAGASVICFSTGRGAPQGFPLVPVLKICGNPITFENMGNDMDINAGKIVTGEKSLEEVGEETFEKVVSVAEGEITKGEAIRYTRSLDIYCLGPVI